MKKLQNLKGAKALNRKEQQSINGGSSCIDICIRGWDWGKPCVTTSCNAGLCGAELLPGGGLIHQCVVDPS